MPTRSKGKSEVLEESDELALKDVIVSQFSKTEEELVEFKQDIITKLNTGLLLAIETKLESIEKMNVQLKREEWGNKEGD